VTGRDIDPHIIEVVPPLEMDSDGQA